MRSVERREFPRQITCQTGLRQADASDGRAWAGPERTRETPETRDIRLLLQALRQRVERGRVVYCKPREDKASEHDDPFRLAGRDEAEARDGLERCILSHLPQHGRGSGIGMVGNLHDSAAAILQDPPCRTPGKDRSFDRKERRVCIPEDATGAALHLLHGRLKAADEKNGVEILVVVHTLKPRAKPPWMSPEQRLQQVFG
jgi:hypothetical protein